MKKPKSAGMNLNLVTFSGLILRVVLQFPFTRRKLIHIAEIADYKDWLFNEFECLQISNRRETVWEKISEAEITGGGFSA